MMYKSLGKMIGFIILISTLSACSPDTLINTTELIEGESWKIEDTLEVSFQITDTSKFHNIFLTTRITPDYSFSNLYVYSVLIAPNDKKLEGIKSFDITTKSGKWLGSGLGDLHSYSLPVIENYAPKKAGTYTFKIVQYMRQDNLPGCHDRGIRVEIGKDIF